MTFGKRLKTARIEKKMTQKQLADLLSVKHNSISNWENDINKPDPSTIELICGVLEITPNFLLATSADEFSPAEKLIIKKYRELDTKGKEMVDFSLQEEWERCTSTYDGFQAISSLKIEEPIFLSKDFFNYNIMKEKSKILKSLMKKNYKDYMDIVKFLWSIGYNAKICIADLVGIVNGLKVPSSQLYDHIFNYLTGNYEIRFPSTGNTLIPNAAHSRTDIELPEDVDTSEEDVMDEDKF